MNYLAHLNGFRLRRAENPLNTQELALYFILCEYANDLYFPRDFTAANGVLQGLSGLSLSALKRARTGLGRKGYIRYKNGYANRAGRYELISLEGYGRAPGERCGNKAENSCKPGDTEKQSPRSERQSEPQNEPQSEPQSEWQQNRPADTLYKRNQTKENQTKNPPVIFPEKQLSAGSLPVTKEEVQAIRKKYPGFSEDQIWYLVRKLKREEGRERREETDVCRS